MRVSTILGSFVPVFKKGFFEIRRSFKKLTLREMAQDFISVSSSIGFVALPAFLIGFLFLILPQGRDTLLLVTENLTGWNPLPLVFLIISIFFWSITSELSVRYSIYVSDNSGKSLNDDRVYFRKTVQKFLAGCFLLWPYVVIIAGLLWNILLIAINGSKLSIWMHVVTIVLVYALMVIKTNLYFGKFGKPSSVRALRTRWGARSLPEHEYSWVQKLYGIYNDYVFTLPKYTNFVGKTRKNYEGFSDEFLLAPENFRNNFPKNNAALAQRRLVPKEFELVNSGRINHGRGELYKWVYRIPTTFYSQLHRKIVRMGLTSVVILLLVAFCPVEWDILRFIGAPALICAAFACYSGLYCTLLYIDKGYGRNWKISVRFLFLLLFGITVFYNQDHPARVDPFVTDKRPEIKKHFSKWLTTYRKALNKNTDEVVPVFFICAEGGAFRTGAYTSLYLTELEKEMSKCGIDFHKSIYAMSGVSGGAVGLGYYNATAYKDVNATYKADLEQAKRFFAYDCLSPVVAKMLYGEFINLFIPWHIQHFDRAIALETSWEMAFGTMFTSEHNAFKGNFLGYSAPTGPLFIINTTEAETGLQCWISSVNVTGQTLQEDRDLLHKKVGRLNYSTAINFSSRFPLFSPGAKVENGLGPNKASHYVDGGYVENTGAASMLEVLKILKKSNSAEFKNIRPIVIMLKFSETDPLATPSITVGNELTEVVSAIYNTRSGRTRTALSELGPFLKAANNGYVIEQPLRNNKVPMNWVLSDTSMQLILEDIKTGFMDNECGIFSKPLLEDMKKANP